MDKPSVTSVIEAFRRWDSSPRGQARVNTWDLDVEPTMLAYAREQLADEIQEQKDQIINEAWEELAGLLIDCCTATEARWDHTNLFINCPSGGRVIGINARDEGNALDLDGASSFTEFRDAAKTLLFQKTHPKVAVGEPTPPTLESRVADLESRLAKLGA